MITMRAPLRMTKLIAMYANLASMHTLPYPQLFHVCGVAGHALARGLLVSAGRDALTAPRSAVRPLTGLRDRLGRESCHD